VAQPGARVIFLMWRDTGHPDGGGSEVFVEKVAKWLVENGHHVQILCAAYRDAPPDEERDGIAFRRRGGRFTVYLHGLLFLLTRAGRRADIVVDVQNGLPFWSTLVRRRRTVVVLTHHCHREQWRLLFPGWPGRFGCWLETRVAPRVYRRRRYITVSQRSRIELIEQGIDSARISVVNNGVDPVNTLTPRSPTPTLCVLARLVPHKQVEQALEVLAKLRAETPDLHLDVVGDGWWHAELVARAEQLGVTDSVTFHGHVAQGRRDELLARSWLVLLPSIKEGWGIAIMEAAAAGTAAIAYRHAGGVAESIIDGLTGVLVDDVDGFTEATRRLLADDEQRNRLAAAAHERAQQFSWNATGERFAVALDLAGNAANEDRGGLLGSVDDDRLVGRVGRRRPGQ
jgi:glycosyltransferase involved in cell wall biosynthesis